MSQKKTIRTIRVVRVTRSDMGRLAALWRACALEDNPQNVAGTEAGVAGFKKSLSRYDFLSSDSFWMLAAEADEPTD